MECLTAISDVKRSRKIYTVVIRMHRWPVQCRRNEGVSVMAVMVLKALSSNEPFLIRSLNGFPAVID